MFVRIAFLPPEGTVRSGIQAFPFHLGYVSYSTFSPHIPDFHILQSELGLYMDDPTEEFEVPVAPVLQGFIAGLPAQKSPARHPQGPIESVLPGRTIDRHTRGVQGRLHGIGVVRHPIPTRTQPEDVVFGRGPESPPPTDEQWIQTSPPGRRIFTTIVHPDGGFTDRQVVRQRCRAE